MNIMNSLKAKMDSLTAQSRNLLASQITRLIVADHYVSPFLGISSRISITCAQFDERKHIEPVYCKKRRKL